MKRIILTVLGILLTLGGLLALGFAVVSFLRTVPESASFSSYEIGLYLPGYAVPGVIAAVLGLILLTVRRFW